MLRQRCTLVLALTLAFSLPTFGTHAADKGPTIKKCKNATGQWYYGDE